MKFLLQPMNALPMSIKNVVLYTSLFSCVCRVPAGYGRPEALHLEVTGWKNQVAPCKSRFLSLRLCYQQWQDLEVSTGAGFCVPITFFGG